ncbi:hypothetical protein TNCV_468631 [Trichonephila clavipes]|nr:hypothetical protein TNCV_468631 [Trichonephila clavipes]
MNRNDSGLSSLSEEADYQGDKGRVRIAFTLSKNYNDYMGRGDALIIWTVPLVSTERSYEQEMDHTSHSTYDRLYHFECIACVQK